MQVDIISDRLMIPLVYVITKVKPQNTFSWTAFYTERQILFNLAEHLIPRFMQLNRKEKYDILTEGINKLDPEFYYTNINISLAVQKFIQKTKRFSSD